MPLIILLISIFSITVIFLYIRKKHFKFSKYSLSEYYGPQNFPKRVFVKNMDDLLMNATKRAAQNINEFLNFTVFSPVEYFSNNKDCFNCLPVKYESGNHYDGKFDGPGGILAHAQLPPHASICVDQAEKWTENQLCAVMMHEMGHTLGLLHSKDENSIMYFQYSDDRKNFTTQDKQDLYTLYPFMN